MTATEGHIDAVRPAPRVGMQAVAQKAGVSVATVSNAINRPELVSQALRRRVETAISELGYIPNAAARSLRTGRTESLGAVVFDLANPFFAVSARHMSNVANDRGYALTVMSTDQVVTREEASLDFLIRHGVRGIVVTTALPDLSQLVAVHDRGVGVMLLAQESDHPAIGSVHVDDFAGMRLLVEHLIRSGRRQFGFVDGPGRAHQHVARRAALLRVLEEAGLDPAAHLTEVVASAPDLDGGRAATVELLARRGASLDAIVGINDYTAIGVMLSLQSAGLSVPDDIAVTGFDDIDIAKMLAVPLTTIRQPMAELGSIAVGQLIDACESGSPMSQRVLVPELVIRRSTST